jgi:histone arginine demethylase JMJD6
MFNLAVFRSYKPLSMKVHKLDDISSAFYMQDFYQPAIPVVFKNASKVRTAEGRFSPYRFRSDFGDRTTEVKEKTCNLLQFMGMNEGSSESNPAPYRCISDMPETIPGIMSLLGPLNLNYAKPNWLESKWINKGHWKGAKKLFFGGPGGRFPFN